MAKVVFISLYNKEPIGVRYLASRLKNTGHKADIIFLKEHRQVRGGNVKSYSAGSGYHTMIDPFGRDIVLAYDTTIKTKEIELLLGLIDELQPDLIGLTLTTVILKPTAKVTEIIKRRFDIPIIWGGIEPTIEPKKCLDHADIVCRGEGEGAIVELAQAIDDGREYTQIENLWVRDGEIIHKNPLRPLIQDLDNLPFPDLDIKDKFLIENNLLFRGEAALSRLDGGVYEIISARGCPFSCSYCCNGQLKNLYKGQRFLRRRSVANVIEELKSAKKIRQPFYVYFHDDIFTFHKRWINEFAQAYKKGIALPFWCNVHPLCTKEEVMVTLKAAGLQGATFGIQSGSERVANDIYDRRVKNADIVICSQILQRVGIEQNYDLITNNPLETETDLRQTLELLLSLPKPVRLNNGISKLSLFPGTEIEKMLKDKNETGAIDERLFALYNRLYLVTQIRVVPVSLIRWMATNSFVRNHSGLLSIFFIAPHMIRGTKDVVKKFVPRKLWLQAKLLLRGG